MGFSQVIRNMIQSFQDFMFAFRRTLMPRSNLDEEVGDEEEGMTFIA
jgi:hypothetical protein